MRYCEEVSKLARGVHSQDVYRVPDGRKYCASIGSRCFPCLFPIWWQTRPRAFVQRSAVLAASIRCSAPCKWTPALQQGPSGRFGVKSVSSPPTGNPHTSWSSCYHCSGGQSSSDGEGAGGASAACSGGCVSGSAKALCALWLAVTLRSHSTELVDGMSLIVFQSCGT